MYSHCYFFSVLTFRVYILFSSFCCRSLFGCSCIHRALVIEILYSLQFWDFIILSINSICAMFATFFPPLLSYKVYPPLCLLHALGRDGIILLLTLFFVHNLHFCALTLSPSAVWVDYGKFIY